MAKRKKRFMTPKAARRRQRKLRSKRAERRKKEFTYRGFTLEKLQALCLVLGDELDEMVNLRIFLRRERQKIL